MRVWVGAQTLDGVLDEHRGPGDYRVAPIALKNLERCETLVTPPGRDLRKVLNYAREIGSRAALTKIWSRLAERYRNEKFISCGLGRVLEAPEGAEAAKGALVSFLLPAGPPCADRIVLPAALVRPVREAPLEVADGSILHLEAGAQDGDRWWSFLRGWHAESGRELPAFPSSIAFKEVERLLASSVWQHAKRLERGGDAIAERRLRGAAVTGSGRDAGRRPRATLVGYGNYAKSVILPVIGRHLDVERIHEVDPLQIAGASRHRRDGRREWSTAPSLTPDDRPDAVLVAGWHHTHAPVACEALQRGAAVVLEKPIATSAGQLRALVQAMDATQGRLFVGFQRRYAAFNDMARQDLGLGPGDPVSYHAIAFAVPLPEHHWYRWPRSGSKLVSNGCHWIDHFLHLNGFAAVEKTGIDVAPDGALVATLTLANGAFFSLSLTDQGSRRLGMREHVELRANGATVTIEDTSRYCAEDAHRILRRARLNRQDAYRRMYDSIGRRVASGEPGDSIRSVERSAGAVFLLEEHLHAEVRARAVQPLVPTPLFPESHRLERHEIGPGSLRAAS